MIRRIIHIDESKCNGCGACANACHEGAIGMVNGKAKLLRDDYCDGLGDCLPTCPTGAITFVEREALEYDREAVEKNMKAKAEKKEVFHGCPSSRMHTFNRTSESIEQMPAVNKSQLGQWRVKLSLCRLMRRILTMQSCLLRQTARLTLTQICIMNLCVVKLQLSAVLSLTI